MWDSSRDTDVKNRFLDSVGEGEGGMICKNRIETCILPYVKQIASPGSMQEPLVAQTVKTVPAMPETQVRCMRQGAQDGGHMYTHDWFISMYGKNYYNIVK